MPFETDLRKLLDDYLVAYEARDASACAGFYTEDGEIHSPFGTPVRGRAAICEAHEAWFAVPEENKRLEVLSSDASGDLGYALLRYSADTADGLEAGTSLNVLEIDETGRCRFRITSLNTDYETIESVREPHD
ncbi:YybH family protein [Aliiruegeria sabulilitoris]|uniref:YybH family protein n=1 Tax=Aliiruegeria sabulilitoris TaxID=1510458 RepID=UPI0008348912|nr:nuclear transport factor 2 family protein [Aliiruegeria sabulilitoris]NDR56179.1 DUF4440 domain-containing protein [Pseudoruegeria sp. M32A2M]